MQGFVAYRNIKVVSQNAGNTNLSNTKKRKKNGGLLSRPTKMLTALKSRVPT